jgi:hypothetical protein
MTELYNTLTKPELIMGLVVLLGGIVMALQKLGLIAISFRKIDPPANTGTHDFAKQNHQDGKCPDPECSGNVRTICENVDDLKVEFKTFKKEIFNRMDKDSRRMAYISGSLGLKED